MTDGARIVPLFSEDRDSAAPVTAKPRDPSRPRTRQCKHAKTLIDPDHRRVVCKDCGEVVDAFDALLAIADDWDRHRQSRAAAERTARLAQKRLEDLQLEERRAKGRLRRMCVQERDLKNKLTRLDAELRSFTP
jgi:transcription initiation factor TFIIIB Brf1 subunit/transcription initiation factor TFIIB